MIWNKMQEEARANGWLVFAMDQGQTIYKQDPKFGVTKGYCLGMACQWLSDMYHHRTFKYGSDKVCSHPPLKGVRVQAATQNLETTEVNWRQWDAALLAYSMHRDTGFGLEDSAVNTPKSEDVALKISNKIAESVGGYAFSWMGVAGHAMAMYRTPSQFDLFDSNHGHFRFNAGSASISFALEWFLDHTPYMEFFSKLTRLCKVNKPYDKSITENKYSRPTENYRFDYKPLASEVNTLPIITNNPDPVLRLRKIPRGTRP